MKSFMVAISVILLLGSPACSEILEVDFRAPGDALLTRDTTTGLEWLDLAQTSGLSFREVSARFGPGGQFEGFRYATAAEVVTFWRSAGLVDIDLPGFLNFTAANFPGAVRLGQLVGSLDAFPNNGSISLIVGFSSTTDFSGLHRLPWVEIRNLQRTAEARTTALAAPFLPGRSWIVRPAPVPIEMDLKPGSCPNRLNPNAHGVLPIAVLATAAISPESFDLATLELSRADGVGSTVRPLLGPPGPGPESADLGAPTGSRSCDSQESGGVDGLPDLALKLSIPDLVEALQLEEATESEVDLLLRGRLLDGTRFEARDSLVVRR